MANSVSHAALPYPVKGCRFTIGIPYLDADGDPTDPTTPDTERSIDAAAYADCTEEVTTITGSNGSGYITLTGDEMNGSLIMVAAKVASGPKATLATLYPRVLPIIYSGTASAGAAGSITLATDVPAIADILIGCIVRTTGGTGGGGGSGSLGNQARVITDFTTGRVASVAPNWETTPDATTTYEIFLAEAAALRYADVKMWRGTEPNALQSGRVDSYLGAGGAGVIDAAMIGTGAIDADAIAADAIGSSELATSAVNEIRDAILLDSTPFAGANIAAIKTVTDILQHLVAQRTTIATLASQTSFTLTAGSADNDAYNGCIMVIEDATTAAQKAVAVISDYAGATKTITLLNDPGIFTMAVTDIVTIIADRAVKPTVDNRTLGVAADGDLLEVNTLTGHTAQTGDNFARLGAPAGASVSADILTIDNLVDDLESRLGTPSNLGSGATVAANLVDIEGQTDDIGAAGGGLTAIPWNAAWDAEVQSEVDDALVARFLDKLVLAAGTADSGSTTTMVDAARTEADADYWKGRLIVFTSGVIVGQCAIITDFNATTDTFTFAPALTQAVATQTYVILPGISVWDDTLAEHLAAGSTGNALNAAGSAGDPWTTALPGAYGAGTAGKIVGDNVNATISSRASQASVDAIDDFVDTEVAAIKAKTDQLTFTNANKVDAGVLTAADFAQAAADKVWSSATRTLTALGASLVQEIWDRATSALTTAGSIGKLLVDNVNATVSSRATPAQVNTEVLDVLNTDTFSEPSAVPAATTTLVNKIGWLFTLARNKITETSTTQTLRNDADSASIATAAVSDDATTFTRNEWT